MCGIVFALSHHKPFHLSGEALQTLKSRGPDSLVINNVVVQGGQGRVYHATFASSVLALRGATTHIQPLRDTHTGSILCWNGEAWWFDGKAIQGNDSQFIFDQLLNAVSCLDDAEDPRVRDSCIQRVLTQIAGPYAMVFYDAIASRIYFARDSLGRRSLLIDYVTTASSFKQASELIVSSFDVKRTDSATEVPVSGICCIDLHNPQIQIDPIPRPTSQPQLHAFVPQRAPEIPSTPCPEAINGLQQALMASLRTRILDIPTYNTFDIASTKPSRIAILFSGGIDCTLLARLCHSILSIDQPIDLLNVAFENPRVIKAATETKTKRAQIKHVDPYEECPDRVTGRASYEELCNVCSTRLWRFVAINIPFSETQAHRPVIIQLMYPHNTEMDLSIAMALYFAARGTGTSITNAEIEVSQDKYVTTARVLLSGLGADELFGGYSRHAAAFTRGGFEALNEELELDFSRIGSRNLGRDDRVIAHWSREVRYPFLDEDFVRYSLALPAWDKVGFRLGKQIAKHFDEEAHGIVERMEDLDPAKMILRCLMWQLGMRKAAAEKKRAIQFGARTAKMHGGRSKGTDILSIA